MSKEGTETSASDDGDAGADGEDSADAGEGPVGTEDDEIRILLADGPGFGPLVALLAMAASGLLVRRRG